MALLYTAIVGKQKFLGLFHRLETITLGSRAGPYNMEVATILLIHI